MSRKFYTLDDLHQFCKMNNFDHFSSKEAGAPLVVQTFGTFEVQEESNQGLIPVSLRVCHTELNRNNSFIANDVMTKRLTTLYNRPILGYIHKTDEGWDFYDHRMSIVEDGDDVRIEYDERPIGIFPESCEPHLEYDEIEDKNYVVAKGLIYADYGNRAYDIIKSKGGSVKVSAEICVLEMSFNAKDNYLSIDDFYFNGCTCLGSAPDGTPIEEGMKGSKLSLTDFGTKNSMFGAEANCQKLLVDTLEKLNSTLSAFSYKNLNKGGTEAVNKFEELLAQYGKTMEDVNFEIEGLSDEELEAKFAETFGEEVVETVATSDEDVVAVVEEAEEVEVVEDVAPVEEPEVTPEVTEPTSEYKFTKSFSIELSHEDIRFALYNLIAKYEEEDNDYYCIRGVYDNYFYMQGWSTGKLYKLAYAIDGENVELEGDRQEVFELIVTESEKIAIERMRENYAELESKYNELVEFKNNYDEAQLRAEKETVLAKSEYACLSENEAYTQLVANMDNYSVEELSVKADLIFAAHVKTVGNFSATAVETPAPQVMSVSINKKEKKRGPYGNLFAN